MRARPIPNDGSRIVLIIYFFSFSLSFLVLFKMLRLFFNGSCRLSRVNSSPTFSNEEDEANYIYTQCIEMGVDIIIIIFKNYDIDLHAAIIMLINGFLPLVYASSIKEKRV